MALDGGFTTELIILALEIGLQIIPEIYRMTGGKNGYALVPLVKFSLNITLVLRRVFTG